MLLLVCTETGFDIIPDLVYGLPMREKRKKPAEKAVEEPADKPAERPSKKITRWVIPSILEEVRGWPDDVKEEWEDS